MSVIVIPSGHLHEQRTDINVSLLRPRNTGHSGKDKVGKAHGDGLFTEIQGMKQEKGRREAVSVTQIPKSLSISIFVKLQHKRGCAIQVLSITLGLSQ